MYPTLKTDCLSDEHWEKIEFCEIGMLKLMSLEKWLTYNTYVQDCQREIQKLHTAFVFLIALQELYFF